MIVRHWRQLYQLQLQFQSFHHSLLLTFLAIQTLIFIPEMLAIGLVFSYGDVFFQILSIIHKMTKVHIT